jgi:hypothetical protein
MTLDGAALVVHLFVDAGRQPAAAEHDYLDQIWQRLRAERTDPPPAEGPAGLGLTAEIAGLGAEPSFTDTTGLLAGIHRPGVAVPHVEEALLRREHDTFCLSVMREPAGASWAGLEQDWLRLTDGLAPPPGLIGIAYVFVARLPRPGIVGRLTGRAQPDPVALTPTVRHLLPGPGAVPAPWSLGVVVSHGYAVWEASSETTDERANRRIVVVAADDPNDWVSGWTWVVGPDRHLPELARYLLHAAKLRHQLRVWKAERPGFQATRRSVEDDVDRLLGLLETGRPTSAQLLEAAQNITVLQADERGLVRTHTALLAMRRTVDIATANLTALSDPGAGGPFADDRALGEWFDQQLDDDAVYVGGTQDRVGKVAALTDQLLQRRAQDERERFNLAFTGAVGAILMVLAASQAFGYEPPLSHLVQPAVVTLLGAVAALSTLLMLSIVARGRSWARGLVCIGWGLVGASAGWVAASALLADRVGPATTRWWAFAGFVAGCLLAALPSLITAARRRGATRGSTAADHDHPTPQATEARGPDALHTHPSSTTETRGGLTGSGRSATLTS